MNKETLFELALFDPDNTLVSLLEKQDIEFRKVPMPQKFVVATDETIKVVSTDKNETLIKQLALIFIEWLKANQYRKLQAQLVDTSIVYIDQSDFNMVINILSMSLKITAFDPEYNNRILNK